MHILTTNHCPGKNCTNAVDKVQDRLLFVFSKCLSCAGNFKERTVSVVPLNTDDFRQFM